MKNDAGSSIKEFFLRDSKRNPVALIVSEWLPGGAVLNVAVSMWNPRDVFDKRVAREVAYGRLRNHDTLFTLGYLSQYGNVKRGVLDFVSKRPDLYSTRTVQAARLWLQTESQREHERKFKGTHLEAWGRKLTPTEWGVLKDRVQEVIRKFVTDGAEVMD